MNHNEDDGCEVHDLAECNPMSTAPKTGVLLRLRVDYSDAEGGNPLWNNTIAWTVGFNNFEHDAQDEWKLAGWCWTHDHFTEGKGTPIGWLPFHEEQVRVEHRPAAGQKTVGEVIEMLVRHDPALPLLISSQDENSVPLEAQVEYAHDVDDQFVRLYTDNEIAQ